MKIGFVAASVLALSLVGAAGASAQSGNATGPGPKAKQNVGVGTSKPANVNQGTKNAGEMATKKGQDCPPGLDKKKVC